MQKKLIFIWILSFIAAYLSAQNEQMYDYGNKKTTDEMYNACRSQDDGILSVGRSEVRAEDGKGWDAALMKTDYLGALVFRKKTGSPRADDMALCVAEDPSGRIWTGGKSDSAGVQTAWLSCWTPLGGFVWHKNLFTHPSFATVSDLQVSKDGNSLAVCAIEGSNILFARFTPEGDFIVSLKKPDNLAAIAHLQPEKITLTEGADSWYIYGCGKTKDHKRQLFILKINSVGVCLGAISYQPDKKNIQASGRCTLTHGGNLLATGTAEVPPFQEEAFTWYVPADLSDKNMQFQTFGGNKEKGSRLDEAYDIIALDPSECLVVGRTRSFKAGSQHSNMCAWRTDHYGKRLSYKMYFYDAPLEEGAVRAVRMYSGDVWFCGTKNDGNSFKDDRNFAFLRVKHLSLPLKWATTARAGNIAFNAPGIAPAIRPGTHGTLEIEVINEAAQPAEGMVITAQCPPDMKGCYAGVRYALPPMQPNEKYVARIPLWADVEAPALVNELKLQLANANGDVLAQKTTKMTVNELDKPRLRLLKAVSAISQEPKLTLGEGNKMEISIKNEGTAEARNVIITFKEPEGAHLSGNTEIKEAQWPVGAIRTYNITVAPERDYASSLIEMRIYVDGEKLKDHPDISAVFQITTLPQKIAVPQETTLPANAEIEVRWADGNDALDRRTGKPRYQLIVQISGDTEVNYSDVVVLHNGDSTLLSGIKSDRFQLKRANESRKMFIYRLNADMTLRPRDNVVQVVVKKGNKRVVTPPLKIYYTLNQSTLYVVSIGVPDNRGILKYTQKDARDMARLFASQEGKIFGNVVVRLLTAPDSTRADNISEVVSNFSKMARRGLLRSTDAILFFISTHGITRESDRQFRLLASNYSPGNDYTSIPFKQDILDKLDTLSCHKFLLIDACHSEASLNGVKGGDDGNDYAEAIKRLATAARTTRILGSCGEQESSYEDDAWENGAFTKIFKDILSDVSLCQELDQDNAKGLSIGELFPRLQLQVNKLVKEKRNQSQTPFANPGAIQEGIQIWGY